VSSNGGIRANRVKKLVKSSVLIDNLSHRFEDTGLILALISAGRFGSVLSSFPQALGHQRVRSMSIKQHRIFATIAIVVLSAAPSSAVVLFSDNFNTGASSANWTKNAAPAANAAAQTADFGYDFSSFGIPPAPGSADTTGLRLRANVPPGEVTTRPAGVLSGLSVSPTGQNFGTNYKMTVYAWSNFFGAPNASGLADNTNSEGGTANIFFGAGTSGTVPMVVGNGTTVPLATGATMDGIGFATTGDGGLAPDWRVYPKSGTVVAPTTPNVYEAAPAGSATASSNADAFYTAKFPTQTAPAVQQTIATNEYNLDAMNPMLGNMQTGSFGFAWHKVVVTKSGNLVTWDIDDNRIAKFDASALTLGGSNIAIGVSDVNASTARHPSLVFTIFDNLQVEDVAAPGVAGDYNGNGLVDAADYVIWRDGGPLQNEVSGVTPGTVTVEDYDAWRARFGNNAGSGSGGAVPEPGTLVLLTMGAIGCWSIRRRS